jgi:hypothetical protein
MMAMAIQGTGRIVKAEPAPASNLDYLEIHLYEWARWMRSGLAVQTYGKQAVGLSNGGASQDFDDMLEAEQRRIAAVVDSVINDLPPIQRMAIHHRYLHAVFRLKGYVQALKEAKVALRVGLRRKHIWLGVGG